MHSEGELSEPVRYILGGKKYEVPLGYHYTDFLKGKKRWPNPKDDFSEAGAISITGLVPGFMPYDESNKGEFERLGYGNKVHLLVSPDVKVYPMEEYLRRMKGAGRLQSMPSALEGLSHYWDNYGASDKAKGHFSKPPSPLQPVSRHDVAHDHPAHQALVFLASPAWR